MRDRNWRRYQNKRIEKKAFEKFARYLPYWREQNKENILAKAKVDARLFRDNMCNCSCFMCGNPRKHWKNVTLQEKKANDIFKSQDLD